MKAVSQSVQLIVDEAALQDGHAILVSAACAPDQT